jgi:hypothetical protein
LWSCRAKSSYRRMAVKRPPFHWSREVQFPAIVAYLFL